MIDFHLISGKTLLAKAIANESGINFISVKGPELLNMVKLGWCLMKKKDEFDLWSLGNHIFLVRRRKWTSCSTSISTRTRLESVRDIFRWNRCAMSTTYSSWYGIDCSSRQSVIDRNGWSRSDSFEQTSLCYGSNQSDGLVFIECEPKTTWLLDDRFFAVVVENRYLGSSHSTTRTSRQTHLCWLAQRTRSNGYFEKTDEGKIICNDRIQYKSILI